MSSPPITGRAGAHQDLLLKVTPPRVPRDLVARRRLMATAGALRDAAILLVQAPAGFGKTSLLAQWRKEIQATGVAVAWVSAHGRDDPHRLVQSLALAVRVATGKAAFGRAAFEFDGNDHLEHATVLLAELAHAAQDVVLIVDEADKLPAASRDTLVYLLRQAPANLRTVMAARPDWPVDLDDLRAYGQCVDIGPALLRFDLGETLQLVHARAGTHADRTLAARLHALTEGWPLGLQLALSIVSRSGDASAGVTGMALLGGELQDQLVTLLLANLDAQDRDFLVRVAMLDHLHPDLCRAVTGDADAASRLARLGVDTPVYISAEDGVWRRMHALVRDALRQHFGTLAADEQVALHARAAQWLAEQGFLDDAARHALAAGQHQSAYDLAERSLYASLMQRGRQGAVLEWLAHMPAHELNRRPQLLLAVAWTLASSERHAEAERFVGRILALPEASDAMRRECALILSGAAVFADAPDRFIDLYAPWSRSPPPTAPLLVRVHANRMAYRALLDGEPAQARLWLQPRSADERGGEYAYIGRWTELITGLSYLWEGQMQQAEQVLKPALASAEAELGRRNRFSSMLAALLAVTAWEGDRPAEAAALLADRLDILEHSGLPDALLLAYRTAARVAVAEGAEHRALELLDGLHAVATARHLPRLRLASLVEQVRLHARSYRAQTCHALCARIDALIAQEADAANARPGHGPIGQHAVQLLREQALVYAAIAARDWRGALTPLAHADELARQSRFGRLHIELLGLRALALARISHASEHLVREAIDLASAYGMKRVLADAHPDLAAWVATLSEEKTQQPVWLHAAPAPAPVPVPPPVAAQAGSVLTPKEREVLLLLARNLSNKEIGRALDVGETTIKWHVKNLFFKLDAGTRKQVVQRARILGLIDLPG
ncbi:MAG: LuxR C-terminal-related transcriptional regulator [Pseudomonadota bacterium]|nr:LuxR C-terminal-related transcriptional regulator [Pseudomonadota bacterium]